MVIISVCYPKHSDSHFDHAYYQQTHMPMVRARWQPMGLVSDTLVLGIATLDGDPPAFELIGLLTFESPEKLQAALLTSGSEVMADIPNFTNVTPLVQINDPI